MREDFAVAVLMLGLAGVFWSSRDYITPYGGMWPDAILIALAALSALLLLKTAVAALSARSQRSSRSSQADKPAASAPAPAGKAAGATPPPPPAAIDLSQSAPDPLSWVLGMSVALAVWLGIFWKLGFVVGGVLGFTALAGFLAREGRADWRLWGRALAAGAAWVVVLYLAFGRMLSVPLPFGWWGGRY